MSMIKICRPKLVSRLMVFRYVDTFKCFISISIRSTMIPDYAVQMLGVIVEAYAAILAIGAAFYIFFIQQFQSEFDEYRRRVEKAILTLEIEYGKDIPSFRQRAFNEGPEWIRGEIKKLPYTVEGEDINMAFIELDEIFSKFNKHKDRSERIPKTLFGYFIAGCFLNILYPLGLILWLSLGIAITDFSLIAAYIMAGISLLFVSGFAWALGKFRK